MTQLLSSPPLASASDPLSAGVLNSIRGPAGCWETLRQQRSTAASCVLFSNLWPGVSWAHFLTVLLGHGHLIYDLGFPYLLPGPPVPGEGP